MEAALALSRRGLAVLVLLFLGALSILVWVDRPADSEDAATKEAEPLIVFAPDKARRVELVRGGVTLTLERMSTEDWRMVSPSQGEADREQVEGLLRTASGARVLRVVEEKAASEAAFGLAPPEAELRVEVAGEASKKVLRIGRLSPIGFERYASAGGGRVVLVDGALGTTLLREPEEFRQKHLVSVDAERVRRLALVRGSERIVVERSGTDWKVLEPVQDLGDATGCDSLARFLAGLSLNRLATAGEITDLLPAFARPDLAAEVADEGGRTFRIQVAVEERKDEWPARRVGSTVVGWVRAAEARELFERGAQDVRERRLVLASAPDVLEVRLEGGGRSLRARREKEGDPWKMEEGGAAAGPADAGKVEDFLDRLRWIRATPADGTDPPASWELTIRLAGGSGELGRLELAPETETTTEHGVEKRRLARSSWRPGFVFSFPAESLGAIPSSRGDLAPEEAGDKENGAEKPGGGPAR